MGSRGIASYYEFDANPPAKHTLPTRFVRALRDLLTDAFNQVDAHSGKKLGQCIGVYTSYDFDGKPIYVGQTTEDFATRIGRHLRGQRSELNEIKLRDFENRKSDLR